MICFRKSIISRPISKVLPSLGVRNVSTQDRLEPYSKFEFFKVNKVADHVIQVEFSRPEARNALPMKAWHEMREIFSRLNHDVHFRAAVLSGQGKMFSAGIDLSSFAEIAAYPSSDPSRKALSYRKIIQDLQDCVKSLNVCAKPVIAAVHNGCIGAGVNIAGACDIRYCSQDAYFQIKEVLVGLAADVGVLQFLSKSVGNHSLLRELVFTGRKFDCNEAKELGLVNRVLSDQAKTIETAIQTAKTIASISPVAVQGSKVNLNFSMNHSVDDGLAFIATWNAAMLQSEDTPKSVMAAASKGDPPTFDDL